MDLGRKVRIRAENEEDLLSSLPDHLIHQILSLIEIKNAVQTSVLSRRWNRVWATLPYLKFEAKTFGRFSDFRKFINKFLSKRNQCSDISVIELNFRMTYIRRPNCYELLKRVTNYAISHNVKQFSICGGITGEKQFPTSIFSSASSLQKLIWSTMDCTWDDSPILWNLPVLTTLQLCRCKLLPLPQFMPALTTLILESVAFHGENSLSFEQLVHLKNLTLKGLKMWHVMEVFSITSLSLKNLTISVDSWATLTCKFMVSAPNLSCFEYIGCSPILLSAKDGLPCLEKVNIDIYISTNYHWDRYSAEKQQVIFQQLISMFQEIRGTKFLTISFDTIKVLSTVSDFSEYQPSPFACLNCLKLTKRLIKRADLTDSPDEVINYLLSISQGATILIQDVDGIIRDYNPKVKMLHSLNRTWSGDSVVEPENISRDDEDASLGTESHVSVEVDNAEEVNKQRKVHADEERAKFQERHINDGDDEETTVRDIMEEQEEENLGRMDFGMEADLDQQEPIIEVTKMIPGQVKYFTNVHVNGAAMYRDPGAVPPNTVPGGVNDLLCSHSVNNNFLLWEGHQVNSEYVDLLQHIKEKYPQTFEHFAPQTEMIYTLGLNTLCASVTGYSKVSTTHVTPSIINHYRGLFADLESWGFNTTWLVNCLKNADEICSIDNRLDDAQRKVLELHVRLDDAHKEVQELQAMRVAKMSEIQEAMGQFGNWDQTCSKLSLR